MQVDPALAAPTEAEVDMADSPAPIPLDNLGDEHMVDDEPTDAAEVIDDGNYAVDEDLNLDEDEVAMADEGAEHEQDIMIDNELGYTEPPQFGSPPAGLTNPDGTQTSALGHSLGPAQTDPLGSLHLQPFELDESKIEADLPDSAITAQNVVDDSATPYVPEPSVETHDSSHSPQADAQDHTDSQTASLSPGRALAAQHQHSSDDKKHQDQSISHQDSHHMRLNQSQDMDQGEGEDPAKQKNQVDIEQKEGQPGEKDEVEVTTSQSNEGGQGGKGGVEQSNEVNVYPDGDKGKGKANAAGGCTCGADRPTGRPELRKELLEGVEFEDEVDETVATGEDGSAQPSLGPVVLLTHQNSSYSLFRPSTTSDTNQPLETLFPAPVDSIPSSSQASSPELYYAPVATLFVALRTTFTAIPTTEELVISFEAIGISLAEDNVHANQVSLFDFDRIQVGCGLPGKLQITLETQPRFSTGFNALVDHIVRSREDGEAYVADEDGSFVDGEYAGGEDTPVTDDETAVGDESEYYDPEGGEDYNLEEALAEMDSDDLEAVIDGVEEDYVESEAAIYEAHDGDEHDELAEGDDGEPDVLLPEDVTEGEPLTQADQATVEVVEAALEGQAEADAVGGADEAVEVGADGAPIGAEASFEAGAGAGEDELVVAIPPEELEALDEAAELYEAGAQEVEGAVGQLGEVAELEEPVVAEEESARSLTGKQPRAHSGPSPLRRLTSIRLAMADTLEDELAEPAQAEDVLADEAKGADLGGEVEPDALGLATGAVPTGEADALGESVLGPKRGREDELEVGEGEDEAEAATKRAKLEDDPDLLV